MLTILQDLIFKWNSYLFFKFSLKRKRIPRLPINFSSLWVEAIKIGQEFLSNISKLKDEQRDMLLKPVNDAIYLFMEGKYLIALENLKKANEAIKQKIS
ncbi:MAG: hypothetical protein ACFFA3_12685 [Promethearchaeota archaeon]